jgi:hypothetical protein
MPNDGLELRRALSIQESSYLRNMLSRCQLQGFVRRRVDGTSRFRLNRMKAASTAPQVQLSIQPHHYS